MTGASIGHGTRIVRAMAGLCLAGAIAACSGSETEESQAPLRADAALPVPEETSLVTVPVDLDARILLRAVEGAVPRTLWTINQRFDRCVPKKQVKVLGRQLNVVPKIGCTVVGNVTRGDIRMRGEGRDIVFDVPIRANVSARDVGGVLKEESATGSAMAQARIRLDLAPDWTPRGTVRLRYNWTRPPGIDFLGQRITFTDQADRHLQPIVRKLESDLPRQLAKLELRPMVERAWKGAFTSLQLNSENPAVWMRLTPRKPVFDGYALRGNRITVNLGIEALTETFVGPKPADPQLVPLPAPVRSGGQESLRFFVPVIADYSELQPVIARALDRRSQRPFDLPGVGETDAKFTDIIAYGTSGGRIAVGLTISATPRSGLIGETTGDVWLEALPVNDENSAEVAFEDVKVTGTIDRTGGDLLIKLANSESVVAVITDALAQNFSGDRDKLVEKVRRALADQRLGDFAIRASIDDVETGTIEAYGEGLYLPVRATGKARIQYRPGQ